jgi:hypothetical protein
MSEQTFIIISCTSTYGVLLCVKFNKKITLDGFEGLQGIWTGGGGGWDFRPDSKICCFSSIPNGRLTLIFILIGGLFLY